MRTARGIILSASVLAVSLLPVAVLAQFPDAPPPPAPIRAAAFPPFQEATLPNGIRLVVVQNRKQPVVAVSLSFPAGSTYDPKGKSGLAEMAGALLTKGAGTRSADEISAAIEGVGGSIGASTGQDFLTLRADVLASSAKLAFELIADAAIRPTFAEKEVELLRTQTLSSLQLELSQPASIADRAFAAGLYGDHPYGRRSDPASLKAITRDDLVQFQKERIRPGGALLVVAGALSLAEARKLADAAFSGWTGAAAAVAPPPLPATRSSTGIVLVHRPGSVQSNVIVGNLTWPPTDSRSYAAAIANRLLGGGADSRLFLVLREQKSWTYGAYSSFVRYKGLGFFEATVEVRTDVTDSALVEMMSQLKRLAGEPVPADEFERSKNSMTGAFPLTIESANQVAAQVSSAIRLGLSPDYVATYRQKLSRVTAAEMQAAAKAAIRPDAALIVVVGDGAKLYDKLKGIAPVRIVSPDGAPLTPEQLTAKAAALDLALDRLVARSDSFAIFVQGNPFGYQTVKLEKDGEGWKYTESTNLGAFVQQTSEVRFTGQLAMQSVLQTGKVQGMETKIDVAYAAGRAKGTALTPQPGGAKQITVDAEVPPGAIDDNLITAILPALKWAAGAKFSVPVFQSGKGTASALTLSVVADEDVEVPAGKLHAWKVEVAGGEQPMTLWVEAAAPNRLLKLAIVGAPIEFRLAK